MLTEFERMKLIGDEFPLPLVAPAVIAKVDAVALAVERAVLASLAAHRQRVWMASRSCEARAFDQVTNSTGQKMWKEHADDLNALLDVLDGLPLGPNA